MKVFFNLFHWLRKKYWKVFKIETFGVRVLVFKDNKVLLVKHRYGKFWVMPGGGINKNETPEQTSIRELEEEAGVKANKIYFKLGQYKNTTGGKNDNISCFIVTDFEEIHNFKRTFIDYLEIGEMGWFNVNNLPNDISGPTKTRVIEFLDNKRDLVRTW
jgi:8-oxo-dGTP pyrophosphatase MutT (NUDIX family)